jgi:hypothetical protein
MALAQKSNDRDKIYSLHERYKNAFRNEKIIRNMNLAIRHLLKRLSAALSWAPWASEMNLMGLHLNQHLSKL